MDDLDLLQAYVERRDQDAFAQLVRRHGGWLYSGARRQVGDGHLAEDVTQAVFVLLARRARSLRGYRRLSGWLFITLGYCVKQAMRQRARMERREREAASMRPESVEEASWDEVAPLLETLVGGLGKADRDAVLLRFYEQKPLAEVGRALGVSEEAARKRVDRAVEKLRRMLQKQGVTGTSAGLSAVLVGNVVQEMPARVVEGVMAAIGGGGSAVAAGVAKGAVKMMVWAKMKLLVIVLAAGAVAVAAGEAVMPRETPPSPAPVVVQRGDPEARKLAAKIAEEMQAQMGKTNRLSYAFKVEHGTPTDEDVKNGRMGAPNGQFAASAGEFGWDKATTREYGKVTWSPDDPARKNVEEFGGVKDRWTALRQSGPGSTDRWAKVTPRRPDGMPNIPAGYFRFGESTTPDMMRVARDIQISQELLDGEKCYRIAMVTEVRRAMGPEGDSQLINSIEPHCLWLSIERGLLPIRCERYYIDDPPRGGQPWTVSHFVRPEYLSDVVIQRELKQMPNGVWFPTEVLTYTFGRDFKWSARTTLSDVAVNEAVTVKTLTIPPAAMKGLLKDGVRDWMK